MIKTQKEVGGEIAALTRDADDQDDQIKIAELTLSELIKQAKQMAGGDEKKKKPQKDN